MSVVQKLQHSPLAPHARTTSFLLVFALLIGIAGYWGPWIAHRTAALVLIGQDLGEFVKFLPEVRNGSIPMLRQIFYLPPFCACCILALLAASPTLRYHWIVRALLLLTIPPLSLAVLPPVFSIPVLRSDEFRLQVFGVILCWALIPATLLLRRVPAFLQMFLIGMLALLGALPALWQFLVILPAIRTVYHAPIHIGWGPIATALGFLTVAFLGFVLALQLLLIDIDRE
jgi:hypothetical protein